MHWARRTPNGRHRLTMPRSNFLSISATSRLGGIDRVKFDEFCKMIEFEAEIRLRKARPALGDEMGNRIGPDLVRLQPAADAAPRFLPLLAASRPRRALAPAGPLWQEPAACRGLFRGRFSRSGHAAVAQW